MREKARKQGVLAYPQISRQIHAWIKLSGFAPGTKLEADEDLSVRFQVGVQTVARAMKELEHDGLVIRRRGSGTYLANPESPPFLHGRTVRLGIFMRNEVLPDTLQTRAFLGQILQGLRGLLGLENAEVSFDQGDGQTSTHARIHSRERALDIHVFGEPTVSGLCHPHVESLKSRTFDVLVLMGILEDEFIRQALALNVPVIIVDNPNRSYFGRADLIFVDPMPGYRDGVQWLARHGCTRIAYLGALVSAAPAKLARTPEEGVQIRQGIRQKDPDSVLRLMAVRSAMEEAGFAFSDDRVHWLPFSDDLIEAWANDCATQPHTCPDGLIGGSGAMVNTVLRVWKRHGIPCIGLGAMHRRILDEPCILVNPTEIAQTLITLVRARMQTPDRASLSVGVGMRMLDGTQAP